MDDVLFTLRIVARHAGITGLPTAPWEQMGNFTAVSVVWREIIAARRAHLGEYIQAFASDEPEWLVAYKQDSALDWMSRVISGRAGAEYVARMYGWLPYWEHPVEERAAELRRHRAVQAACGRCGHEAHDHPSREDAAWCAEEAASALAAAESAAWEARRST